MKRNFLVVLSLCMILSLFGGMKIAAEGSEPYLRERPIPQGLEEVAKPYQDYGQTENVDIRISLPELLLDSPDAKAANEEFAKLEAALADEYTAALKEADPNYDFYYSMMAKYSSCVWEGILSLRIDFFSSSFGETFHYLIYNFDLASGKRLSDSALVEKLGGSGLDMDLLWEENIGREAFNAASMVENSMRGSGNVGGDPAVCDKPEWMGIGHYFTALTLENFRENFFPGGGNEQGQTEKNALFLEESGALKMLYVQAAPAGGGVYYQEAPFYIFTYPRQRSLNPVFVRILETLGEDPLESPYEGLLAFVGSASDLESLDPVLKKVTAFARRWNGYQSPNPVLSTEFNESTGWNEFGTFSEFYLVVPKYQNDYIGLVDVELDAHGNLVESSSEWGGSTLKHAALGVGLIGLSTETMPTGGLHFGNMKERGKLWYPSFSGKDGTLILPETIRDITELVQENRENYADDQLWIDENLQRFIDWFWPKG